MQFPVSSGQVHRQNEGEWVPVPPKSSSNSATKKDIEQVPAFVFTPGETSQSTSYVTQWLRIISFFFSYSNSNKRHGIYFNSVGCHTGNRATSASARSTSTAASTEHLPNCRNIEGFTIETYFTVIIGMSLTVVTIWIFCLHRIWTWPPSLRNAWTPWENCRTIRWTRKPLNWCTTHKKMWVSFPPGELTQLQDIRSSILSHSISDVVLGEFKIRTRSIHGEHWSKCLVCERIAVWIPSLGQTCKCTQQTDGKNNHILLRKTMFFCTREDL